MRFCTDAGITQGRLSQLLKDGEPFGEIAAKRLEGSLRLPPGYFDSLDARTLEFATAFDALPEALKLRWMEIAKMLAEPPK